MSHAGDTLAGVASSSRSRSSQVPKSKITSSGHWTLDPDIPEVRELDVRGKCPVLGGVCIFSLDSGSTISWPALFGLQRALNSTSSSLGLQEETEELGEAYNHRRSVVGSPRCYLPCFYKHCVQMYLAKFTLIWKQRVITPSIDLIWSFLLFIYFQIC